MTQSKLAQIIEEINVISSEIKERSDDPLLYIQRADKFIEQGNNVHNDASVRDRLNCYEKAIADCNIALKLCPVTYSAYHTRGEAKIKMGNYSEGIDDYSYGDKLAARFPIEIPPWRALLDSVLSSQ